MNDRPLDPKIIQALGITSELIGADPMSEAATRIFVLKLMRYPIKQVLGALARCQNECQRRLTPKDVIDRLDDGRPGADEAWGMYPRDEYSSVVLSDEIAEAMGAARNIDDRVAARMAFKEAYTRIVQKNRDEAKPAHWFLSAGREPVQRAEALADGVRRGRIGHEYALSITPPDHHSVIIAAIPEDQRPALPPPPDPEKKRRVQEAISGLKLKSGDSP